MFHRCWVAIIIIEGFTHHNPVENRPSFLYAFPTRHFVNGPHEQKHPVEVT